MADKRDQGFADVENPFGDVDIAVEDYQPPAAGAWQRQDANEGTEDDEPFTAAHLAAATQGTVPSVSPRSGRAAAPLPPPISFAASVAPGNDVSGRMDSTVPSLPRMGASPGGGVPLLSPGAPSSAAAPPDAAGDSDPGSYPFYSIKRYRTYFNVDTDEVLTRVFRAVALFFKADFFEQLGGNPDLYGPFWIASTLVFVSAAAGNLASYLAYHRSLSPDDPGQGGGWYYDVDKVGGSMGLFYGYVGVIGMVMYLILRWFKAGVGLAEVWCTYGYALAAYIPMAALCVLPMEVVRWTLVGLATGSSGAFLFLNFKAPVVEAAGAKAVPILMGAVGLHACLGLALKFYFFHYST